LNKQLIAGALALALAVAGSGAALAGAQGTAVPEIEFRVTAKAVTLAPGTQVPAGYTKLTLRRTGRGESGLVLIRLRPGVTVEQITEAAPRIEDPNDVDEYGTIVASTYVMGSGSYSTTVRLEDADHVWVDMTKKPVVRLAFHAGPADSGASAPRTSATVALRDYRFAMPSRLKPGRQTLKVVNEGKVMHHALVFPLAKGVKERALLKKIRAGKEPTKEFSGPPAALVEIVSPKTTNAVEMNLRRGRYLFICFLQDGPKEKMHAQKGMQKVVTVR
jgi:hypothetical protein